MIEIAETSENACNQTLTIAVSRDECLPLMKVLARRHSNSLISYFYDVHTQGGLRRP